MRAYNVRACLASAPNNCKAKQCTSVNCSPLGPLTPGGRYVVSATANMTTGQQIKAATTLTFTMPAAAAPVLLLAVPAGRRSGKATALPPATGGCPGYFWAFSPAGGGAGVNATTTALSITTAGTALVPGGTYDVRVACVRSGTAAIRSLLQELGPFSNTLRFVMPAAGAPFLAVSATTPTTATATIQPPAGTGKGWQILGSFCTGFPDRQPHMKPLSNPMLPITFHRMEELPADNLPAGRARNQLPQCAVRHPCERLRSDQPCRWHNLHCHSRGHPGRWRHKPGKQHRNVHHLPRGAAHPVRRYLHRRQHLLQK